MSLFKKKKSDKQFKMELENAALEQKNMKDSFENFDSSFTYKTSKKSASQKAPMVLTPEELNGYKPVSSEFDDENDTSEIINMEQSVPKTKDFLFSKMVEARAEAKENLTKNNTAKANSSFYNTAYNTAANTTYNTTDAGTSKNISTDITGSNKNNTANTDANNTAANSTVANNAAANKEQKSQPSVSEELSKIFSTKNENKNILTEEPVFDSTKNKKSVLMDKCKSFTKGAEESKVNAANILKLQSVEEILAEMESKAKAKVEKMYSKSSEDTSKASLSSAAKEENTKTNKTQETQDISSFFNSASKTDKPQEVKENKTEKIINQSFESFFNEKPNGSSKSKAEPEYKVIKNQNKNIVNPNDKISEIPQQKNNIINNEYIDAEDLAKDKIHTYSLYSNSVKKEKEHQDAFNDFFNINPNNDIKEKANYADTEKNNADNAEKSEEKTHIKKFGFFNKDKTLDVKFKKAEEPIADNAETAENVKEPKNEKNINNINGTLKNGFAENTNENLNENLNENFVEYVDAENSGTATNDTIMFSVKNAKKPTDNDIYSTNIFDNISKTANKDKNADNVFFDDLNSGNNNAANRENYDDYNEYDEQEILNDFEPEDEYNTKEDKTFIYKLISKKIRNNKLKIFADIILAVLTFIFELTVFNSQGLKVAAFIAFAVCVLINIPMLGSIINVFKCKNEITLPLSVTTIIMVIYNALAVFKNTYAPSFMFASVILLLLGNIGLSFKYNRIFKNFRIVSSQNQKYALNFCENQSVLKQISNLTDYDDVYLLNAQKTDHINDFMKYSFGYEPNFKSSMIIYLFIMILSVLGAVATAVSGNFSKAFTVFAAGMLLGANASVLFATFLPLKAAASRLHYYGSALFGYKSAKELNLTNTVVLDVGDIFTEGSVKLIDFKLLNPNPVDQTLIDAATLAHNINSPLAGIFKQITDLTDSKIPPVDSVTYEENMGISGWVNDRRIFIGNRTLFEAHGFKMPSIDVDKKILTKGYFPVYLGSEGVLCALLIVKYAPSDEICYELKRLASTGVNIIVNNCDQNISTPMLTDYLDLYENSIYVMSSDLRNIYKETNKFKENVSATACCSKNACGLASTVTAAIKIIKLNKIIMALYAILSIGSAAAAAVMGFMGHFNLFSSVILGLWNILSALICSLPVYLNRP